MDSKLTVVVTLNGGRVEEVHCAENINLVVIDRDDIPAGGPDIYLAPANEPLGNLSVVLRQRAEKVISET